MWHLTEALSQSGIMAFVWKKNLKFEKREKNNEVTNTHAHGAPHTRSHAKAVWCINDQERGEQQDVTVLFHRARPESLIPHTLSVFAHRKPTSALKYIMKYDDYWHMGTVCACSASGPSLACCCAACTGTGSQSCANICRGCVCFVVNHHIATATTSLRGKDAEALIASKRGVAPVSSDHAGGGVCCLMHRKQQF